MIRALSVSEEKQVSGACGRGDSRMDYFKPILDHYRPISSIRLYGLSDMLGYLTQICRQTPYGRY